MIYLSIAIAIIPTIAASMCALYIAGLDFIPPGELYEYLYCRPPETMLPPLIFCGFGFVFGLIAHILRRQCTKDNLYNFSFVLEVLTYLISVSAVSFLFLLKIATELGKMS